MAETYADVVKKIGELKSKAEALRKAEISEVIKKIREAIAVYELTADDLFSKSARRGAKRNAGAAKAKGAAGTSRAKRSAAGKPSSKQYADSNGNTWGGRGPRPQWLRDALAAGHEVSEFLV